MRETLESEKATRDQWIEKFEREQNEHTATSTALMQARSDLKDQVMATKNVEIQHQMATRQLETVNAQNKTFQHDLNEATAQKENLERELATQKEILTQFEANQSAYIAKLKRELETVEDRFQRINNHTAMQAEDNRSFAARNYLKLTTTEARLKQKQEEAKNLKQEVKDKDKLLKVQNKEMVDAQMEWEDQYAQIWQRTEALTTLREQHADIVEKYKNTSESEEKLRAELEAAKEKMEKLEEDLSDANRETTMAKRKVEKMEEELENSKAEADEKIKALQQQLEEAEDNGPAKSNSQLSKKEKSEASLKKTESKKSVKSVAAVETAASETQTDLTGD